VRCSGETTVASPVETSLLCGFIPTYAPGYNSMRDDAHLMMNARDARIPRSPETGWTGHHSLTNIIIDRLLTINKIVSTDTVHHRRHGTTHHNSLGESGRRRAELYWLDEMTCVIPARAHIHI
jgi:hypothetical protein